MTTLRFLDLTLDSPAENLALDDALLDEAEGAAERGQAVAELLRVWEPRQTMVVVGRSSRIAQEVDLDACRRRGLSVLRRSSGGAAIVTGPGCLMYSLVLSYAARPGLRMIDAAHRFVLSRLAGGLRALCGDVQCAGTSDLAIAGRKFSGNSMRCRRECFLYHGTLLYDFPLRDVAQLLRSPPRQPAYRNGRGHGEFLTNLTAQRDQLMDVLRAAWEAHEPPGGWPRDRVRQLVVEKYSCAAWNERL
jgi:lipoate-protein ligase A